MNFEESKYNHTDRQNIMFGIGDKIYFQYAPQKPDEINSLEIENNDSNFSDDTSIYRCDDDANTSR